MIGMVEKQYLIFNKPYGVLSSFTGDVGQATLKEFIDVPGVYAAGRLDLDSEGLLLLTDDGDLIHRLADPRHHLPKTYLVMVEGNITAQALAHLERGVELKGYRTRPARVTPVPDPGLSERVKPVTPHGPTAWLRLVITEGKKRQIRHMTAAVGLPTLRLIRVAIGPLALGELPVGAWRFLSPAEIHLLKP